MNNGAAEFVQSFAKKYGEVLKMAEEYNSVEDLGLCVLHVGINADGEDDAKRIAEEFRTLMGFIPRFGNSSIFASDLIEIMKKNGRGEKGHIAVGAHDVDKAAEYFRSTGMGVDEASVKYDDDGKMKFCYLSKEIAGFAIHLKRY